MPEKIKIIREKTNTFVGTAILSESGEISDLQIYEKGLFGETKTCDVCGGYGNYPVSCGPSEFDERCGKCKGSGFLV